MTWRARLGCVALAGVMWMATKGLMHGRDAFIERNYAHGPGGASAPSLPIADPAPGKPAGLTVVDRVRVILIDGLGAYDVHKLPRYQAICDQARMRVDVGFPTLSLPVQRVLWTGLTQQQSGVQFFNRHIEAPAIGIPGQVPDSRAVAESHAFIAHSLGFAQVLPAAAYQIPDGWSLASSWRAWLSSELVSGFERASVDAMQSDARLAFVHMLRVDSIAHKRGPHSPEYRGTLEWANRTLGTLLDAIQSAGDPRGTRIFVLADHGHRDGGGHGGYEPHIRTVELCIKDSATRINGGDIHLVDVSRAIADSLGVALDPASAGRPLYRALAAPSSRGATMPRPSGGRIALAVMLVLLAMAITGWAARGRFWLLPWWLPIAYMALVWRELPPSMSTSMVYRSDGGEMIYMAALPGLYILAALLGHGLRQLGIVRALVAQLTMCAGLLAAMLALCWGDPPMMPRFTAYAGVMIVLSFAATIVSTLACGVTAVTGGRGGDVPRLPEGSTTNS